MSQTQVQKTGAIKSGSCKMEVGATIATLENIGAARGVSLTESFDKVEVESDNAGVVKRYIKNQRVVITAQQLEVDMEYLNNIRGGIDLYSLVAGSATPVTDESLTLTGTLMYRLANKNGDNSEVTAIVVTNSTGTITYVRNTDFVVGVDSAGFTVIGRIDAGAITSGQSVLADYSYTPNVSKKLTSGGKHTITARVVRLTNTDENGKTLTITVYYATIEEGITFAFPADEAEDVLVSPVNMVGRIDVSKTVGDQLYEILDEQSVA